MPDKKEYVEIEGINCEVKDPSRRATVLYYQETLKEEIDKYIGSVTTWTDSKKGYRDALNINVKIAPFVLGWLKRPEDRDEYNVITGRMTMEELEKKRAKEAAKNKKTTRKGSKRRKANSPKTAKSSPKTATTKKTATKSATSNASKSTTSRKSATKTATKSNSPKTEKSKGSKTAQNKKAAPKKTASKTSKKKS